MNRWIFGSFQKDFLFLSLPGLLMLAIVFAFPGGDGPWDEFLAFFALAFCDSGHVYTTLWRTYANARERNSTRLYWLVPALVLAVVGLWVYSGLPGLWTAVIFLTVFHNYRQFHGVLKWEQKVNKDRDRVEARFLLFLCLWPFLLFHFRNLDVQFYSRDAILYFPWPEAFSAGLVPYVLVLGLWVWRTGMKTLRGGFSPAVAWAVAVPVILYGAAFLWGKTLPQILFPLVVAHAVSYFALMSLSLGRLELPFRKGFVFWMGLIAVTALVFGFGEAQFEEWMLPQLERYQDFAFQPWIAVAAGLYLVPLISHYIFDGWLWTSRHREAAVVFKDS